MFQLKMTKNFNYRFLFVFVVVLLVFNFFPIWLLAEDTAVGGLVKCGRGEAGPGDCGWEDLTKLFDDVLNFIFTVIMIPLAVIAIVWAGWRVLNGKTKPEELIKAKGALVNVAIGIFLALGAYAIIKTILGLLAKPEGILDQAMQQVF